MTGGPAIYLRPHFRVYATPPPAFTVAPCPTGFGAGHRHRCRLTTATPCRPAPARPRPYRATSHVGCPCSAGHYRHRHGPLQPAPMACAKAAPRSPLRRWRPAGPGLPASRCRARCPAARPRWPWAAAGRLPLHPAGGRWHRPRRLPRLCSPCRPAPPALRLPGAGGRLLPPFPRPTPAAPARPPRPLICTLSLQRHLGQNRNQLLLTDAGTRHHLPRDAATARP